MGGMQWATLASTLVGAFIGIGATVITDRLKWERERKHRDDKSRLDLYVEYLAVLSRAVAQIKIAGYTRNLEGEDRDIAIREAFQVSGAYEWHYRVGLVAGPAVAAASQEAFSALYNLREAII